MNPTSKLLAGLIVLSSLSIGISDALALGAPRLGSTAYFAVLSAQPGSLGAVTCTDSTLTGNIGSSGFMPAVVQTRCSIAGNIIAPVSVGVLADYNRAYNELQTNRCSKILTGTQAGIVLPPGTYCFDAAASLTGTLTLSGRGLGVWIFLVNGDLTGNTFTTVMAGGAKPCNVYWGVSGATTMTTSNLKGNVLAAQAITLTGGTYTGRAMAGKAVTLTNVAALGCTG